MLRYLEDVVTLQLDRERCIGCGMCGIVCPHAVFTVGNGKAEIVDRDVVSVGQTLTYSVAISNTTPAGIADVRIEDLPAAGFSYLPGSARVDGTPIADPVDGSPMIFNVGTIAALVDGNGNGVADPGESGYAELTYRMIVSPGAVPGKKQNTAVATSTTETISNYTEATVEVQLDELFDMGLVIGKVYHDLDRNGVQNGGESGVPGAMVALSVADGREKWRWTGDSPGLGASPVIRTIGQRPHLVFKSRASIVGLDPRTGVELWRIPFEGMEDNPIVTPLFVDEVLVTSDYDKGMYAWRLEGQKDTWKARELWHRRQASLFMSSPVVAGELVVGFSHFKRGQLFGLEAGTGHILAGTDTTVVAVLLADVGHQYLEDTDSLAIGQGGGIDPLAQIVAGARRRAAGVAQVVLGRFAQGLDLSLDVHVPHLPITIIAQMFHLSTPETEFSRFPVVVNKSMYRFLTAKAPSSQSMHSSLAFFASLR